MDLGAILNSKIFAESWNSHCGSVGVCSSCTHRQSGGRAPWAWLFKIYSTGGRQIHEYSSFIDEDEVLFMPTTEFMVVKSQKNMIKIGGLESIEGSRVQYMIAFGEYTYV